MYYYSEQDRDHAIVNWPVGYTRGPVAYNAVLSVKFSDEEDTVDAALLAIVKDHCAIDGTDKDTLLNLYIKAAIRKIEHAKQTSLINRTVTAKIKPGTNLPYGPVIEVTGITDDNETDYSDYVNPYTLDTVTHNVDSYTVTYTAGPGESGISDDLKIEILQQVAYMLENRGDQRNNGSLSPIIKERK